MVIGYCTTIIHVTYVFVPESSPYISLLTVLIVSLLLQNENYGFDDTLAA